MVEADEQRNPVHPTRPLPKNFEFEGVTEVEICREGESIILTPKRKSWNSFSKVEKADSNFLIDRFDVIEEE